MAITPDDPHTRDAAALPRGLYGPDEVDVAYEPWRARCVTRLRVGPSAQAPVVLTEAGDPVVLRAGDHLGRQSTRNPACLDTPPLRPAVDGWVWGYGVPPASRKSGWARLADLAADPAFAPSTCGPADEDFDRRRPGSCGGHCDGRPLTDVGGSSGRADVAAREVYLRYAPRSTRSATSSPGTRSGGSPAGPTATRAGSASRWCAPGGRRPARAGGCWPKSCATGADGGRGLRTPQAGVHTDEPTGPGA